MIRISKTTLGNINSLDTDGESPIDLLNGFSVVAAGATLNSSLDPTIIIFVSDDTAETMYMGIWDFEVDAANDGMVNFYEVDNALAEQFSDSTLCTVDRIG